MVVAHPRKTEAINPAISKNTPNDVILSFFPGSDPQAGIMKHKVL